ncbi:MAG: hypothetical protein IJ733_16480 [Lachnospiraceae bacterium]|nr:hypothetical protein [Lachnospiraceae bacterium]
MKVHKKFLITTAMVLSLCMMFHSVTVYADAKNKGKKAIVISFDHRRNIGSTKGMSVDAVSSATVYSGATGEKKSTIEVIRSTLKSKTGAANFSIKVKKTYSKNYTKTVNRARKEIDNDTQVKLKKKKVSGLKKYDTVYLVIPVWHATLPQPVKVFLEANDFSGKTIYVFGSHLGSGFGENVEKVKELCPDAKVIAGKAYEGDAKNRSV